MKRLFALLLCCALLLTGCASMLERGYSGQAVHDRTPAAEGDSSILRAEDYRDLVSAIYYFVSQGQTEGTVRLYNYTRDVEADLGAACLEVVQEDPLGAYAVDYIKYDYTHIVSYYEATVSITYRRTMEQMNAIVSVTGSSAIRSELREALAAFQTEAVLRITYFTEGTDIAQLLREAYYDTPAAALGLSSAEISLYPDQGSQRIVEVLLTYPLEQEEALARSQALIQSAQELTAALTPQPDAVHSRALAAVLRSAAVYDPEGGSTAYDALLGGAADSEGLSLALGLLCQQDGLDWLLISGQFNGAPRCWSQLQLDEGIRYMDLVDSTVLYSAQELLERGYLWDGAPAEAEENLLENEN